MEENNEIREEAKTKGQLGDIEKSFQTLNFGKRLVTFLQSTGQIPDNQTDKEMEEYWESWDKGTD